MAVTRAKATALLNKTEMGLYDDSRANALREHSESRLTQLVTRARTARDRARDLEKRQRLASRKTSGSKSGRTGIANARTGEKAELLADILGRLETRQRDVAKAVKTSARAQSKDKPAKAAGTKRAPAKAAKTTAGKTKAAKPTAAAKTSKSAKKTSTTKQAATRAPAATATKKTVGAAAKKTASAKSAATAPAAPKLAKKQVAKKAVAKKTAFKQSTAAKAASAAATRTAGDGAKAAKARVGKAKNASGRGKRGITPEQALANTRKLLEQREAEAKGSKSWETLGAEPASPEAPGFQSPQARSKVLALHEAETRQASINGSISTRDRRNQSKRDHRSD
ncbi:hypothetical protein [Luteimonas sp. 3794]|uniref:hypothetical protein n=1 Tax=Luteimonas sp. 3794 TaxID=2817730 RepID=UPI00286225DF|nr:hypothetical protein [Luteimonas sp. 3794]MDR6992574.1 myosin heavy subunit [Luteimonas sp. 3794]